MALSIGTYNQTLIQQIQDSKDLYLSMAKDTPIEDKLSSLYTKLTIAYRNYVMSITTAYLPTNEKPTTNIYIKDNKIVGVDHRDYEKEYWDQKRAEHDANKPLVERNLLRALNEINEALDSVPEIKKHKQAGIDRRLALQKENEKIQKEIEKHEGKIKGALIASVVFAIIIAIAYGFTDMESDFLGVLISLGGGIGFYCILAKLFKL